MRTSHIKTKHRKREEKRDMDGASLVSKRLTSLLAETLEVSSASRFKMGHTIFKPGSISIV
jgi:hypothetical protein